MDGAIASIDALPAIAEAVGGDLAVLFDSGIRGGADVFKALALGADAVLLGRPYIWGLALDGQAGVETVLRTVLGELDLTMALSGYTSPEQLSPDGAGAAAELSAVRRRISAVREIDRERLPSLLEAELAEFIRAHPRSRELYERSLHSLVGGVPMPWMMHWAGGFPVFAAEASGARITDVDGHTYVDLCLGDTGAMPGHSPSGRRRGGRPPGPQGDHDDAADRGLGLGRGGAGAPLRGPPLDVHPDRDRRQPRGAADLPADDRPPQDPRLQLLLPRQRR